MYIKQINIEGFKSYAQETSINLFDPHFNAITGLNGSGKSNILDAICFVLGITNLSQVRATNLQELIYKGGNAGITKATVSIIFDNSDKDQSPQGYQDYEEIIVTRQILVGGKHKYLINGSTVNNERVCNLFCSVQLNVNNPNFLIMQGKITKVLNMKPIEILSMIEEAAGTKTYDVKKQNALEIIDKKNAKLNEIERVLKEDITPVIQKLKEERSAFVEYQKIEREYSHFHKISMAYQYYICEESLSKARTDNSRIESDIQKHKDRIIEIEEKMKTLKEEIKKIQKEKDDDGKLNELELKLKELQKEEAKLNSELENLNSVVKSDKKRQKEIDKMINDNNELIKTKEKKLTDLKQLNENAQNAYTEAEAELKNAQKLYEALCCGLSANEDGTLATIQDQLINIKTKISDQETSIKQSELRLKHATDESNKMNKEIGVSTKDYDEKLKNYEKIKQNFDKIKSEVDKLNFEPSQLDTLNLEIRKLESVISGLNDKCQQVYLNHHQLNFEYKNPEPNFDRQRVKGLVCNLFKIKDPKYATALETAAGGKLYNLVVDTDQTGKLILEKGDLKRKTTIIPMNQIRAYVIDNSVIKIAKDLVGNDNVFSALSLIDYDQKYKQVMEYVFGSRLVCTSLDAAKQVAFHKQILTNTITLDGDHFDPDGILTGGARQQRTCVLLKVNELQNYTQELEAKRAESNALKAKFESLKNESAKYNTLKRDYDKELNQLNVAKSVLEQNAHHQKLEKYNTLLAEIDEKKTAISKINEELKSLKQKQNELEEKLNNQDSTKEKEKKLAQEKIKRTKAFLDKNSKSSNEFQKEFETIKMEIEQLKKEIQNHSDEIEKSNDNIGKQNDKTESLKEKIEEIKEQEDGILGEINERKGIINEKNRNISSKSDECDNLNREKNGLELKIKELEHKKANFNEQLSAGNQKLEDLIHAHPWIEEEKRLFGRESGGYDFKNIKEIQHRMHSMKSRKEKLEKQVDKRAQGLLTKKEDEYDELNKKRQIVLKDKSMLETTIQELEQVKIDVLQKAFSQINKDLGSIFNTLLPGAYAKLEQCNKQSILEGVEFKVAFGDVWKESLTELSGGQRSLVALSLILSLLRYKPAPLYILDEVDAALDSSHTQNIGLMIKKHFKNSQFVIVSLKDGMFTNANVLFKTKLIDGVSTVQRFEQKKSTNNDRENQGRDSRNAHNQEVMAN